MRERDHLSVACIAELLGVCEVTVRAIVYYHRRILVPARYRWEPDYRTAPPAAQSPG
jgi:DNA-binding transcriptional MerR regulator